MIKIKCKLSNYQKLYRNISTVEKKRDPWLYFVLSPTNLETFPR